MQGILRNYPNLTIHSGGAFDLVFDYADPSSSDRWGKIAGVKLGRYNLSPSLLRAHPVMYQNPGKL